MRGKGRQGIRITPRDMNLFLFLFQYKCGTLSQLAKYPFDGASYKTTSIRVSQLVKSGHLIKKPFEGRGCWRSYYSLTDKSLVLVGEAVPYKLVRRQKESNHPIHDIELLEVGEWLRNSVPVEEFFTENILQCCEEFTSSNKYMVFSRINSDAAFQIHINGKGFKLALEYESTLKSRQRIGEKLMEYVPLDEVRAVFYICKSEAIEKALREIEVDIFSNEASRVYYCQLEEILSCPQEVVFRDSYGGQFVFKKNQHHQHSYPLNPPLD